MDIPDELLDEIIAKMSAAIDRIHVGTNPEWCDRAAISAFDAAYPLVAARVRADTAHQAADLISAEANADATEPARQTDYWVGCVTGKRSAAALIRQRFGGAP
jgi:hypothetical protein